MPHRFITLLFALALFSAGSAGAAAPDGPQVRLTTSAGIIELELDAAKAPLTVKNFLDYLQAGHYNGTIFHRVIPGFMIQGGGMEPGLREKKTRAPIRNEADNGLKNLTGTIAMARTPDPHSASAQFFINTADNDSLDHRAPNPRDWGYAVFGHVIQGMDVVRKIERTPTRAAGFHGDVPVTDVVIITAELIGAKDKKGR